MKLFVFGFVFGDSSCLGRALFVRGSDDTLLGSLGRCVGANEHAIVVLFVVVMCLGL